MASQRSISESTYPKVMKTTKASVIRQVSEVSKQKQGKLSVESQIKSGSSSVISSTKRRALNQIQNTIVNSNAKTGVQLPEKGTIDDPETKTDEAVVVKQQQDNKNDFASSSKASNYLDDIDLDAPIEVCPDAGYNEKPLEYELDDFLLPEEQVSRRGPKFWNSFLRGFGASDLDNKENIFQYFNEDDEIDEVDIDGLERDLASLELQKLPLLE